MAKILECVPNISEGRNKEVIEDVLDEVRKVPGVTLLDYKIGRASCRERV